jgi:hypothetical protein
MSHKRYVYGTRTNKWYLVGKKDRDYDFGITQTEFMKIGKARAKEKYLRCFRLPIIKLSGEPKR